LHDRFIGDPANFIEPPLGFYVNEQFALQTAKADGHRFMLYQTDFLPGTDQFSPTGAGRFNRMAMRIPGWIGPVTVEWTPDRPELAEARRRAVLAALDHSGRGIVPERVVIAPSPYPGRMGVEAAGDFANTVYRSQTAAQLHSLSPNESATASSSTGGQ
jgi:hypothetical protein